MDEKYDVIIIGAGPAGLTAAIYCARAELKTLVLEYDAPGGKLVKTAEIANWPGIEKTSGVDLALSMYQHALSLQVVYRYGEVIELISEVSGHQLKCRDGQTYFGRAIIIASGTKERLLQVPGEQAMIGRGVSFCAICDGAFFKNEAVAIVGGGNSALEEASYLATLVAKLYIVIRRDQFRADQSYVSEVLANPKIEVVYQHVPSAVLSSDQRVSGLEIEHVTTKEKRVLEVKGIFPYIGADPATQFVQGRGITDEAGYLSVNSEMATAIPGIYGAGDVCAKQLRQVVTAANDGAIAAVNVSHYLK